MKRNEKKVNRMETEEMVGKTNYQLSAFDLDKVEELETALAPGGVGFGCGCSGIFGAYCG